jgi:hypothetical protein
MTVRVYEVNPGDGYAYRAIVSELPDRFEGGGPGTHVHVSVTSPVRWSWTFATDGLLHSSYVAEKMRANDVDPDRWLSGMLVLLDVALGRETAGPVTVEVSDE